tara:strand:- start:1994 stop:2215 length:222 start_codon:yes stop_codon:yes gene_type:complete
MEDFVMEIDENQFDDYIHNLSVRMFEMIKKEVQLYSPDTVNLSLKADAEIDEIAENIKLNLIDVVEQCYDNLE